MNENQLQMLFNAGGYFKFINDVFSTLYGNRTYYTEEEIHQAVEFMKNRDKDRIEQSGNLNKETMKRLYEGFYTSFETFLKTNVFVKV
ncbi:MAG: hypothetical protein IKH63_03900 [Prevotella sp.]|nr:hypothetical protein [Prevotella sp.]